MLKVKCVREFTDQWVQDIMDTAPYVIGHWAESLTQRGGKGWIVVDQEGNTFCINYLKLSQAMSKLLSDDEYNHLSGDLEDGWAIDAIIQLACFDEIVYV